MTRGRFTAFSLTVVVLIAAAVFGLPRARRWGEARLRRSLESRATAVFGGPVRIGAVRIEFVPPGLLLEGVQAEREGNRGSQAIAAADEVSVHASPLTLLAARRGPLSVKSKRPHLTLRLAEGRSLSFGSDPASPAAISLAAVPAGSSLEIHDGQVTIDLVGGPALTLGGLQLLASPDPGGAMTGHAEFSSGSYHGPGGEWPGLSGEVSFVANGPEVRLDPLAIHGEGSSLSGSVTVHGGDAPMLDGAVDVGLDVGKLARFFPEGAEPSGQLKASLSGNLRGGTPAATGSLEVDNFVLWGLSIGTLRSDLAVDEGVHLKGIRAHLLGGEATGTSDVRFDKGRFECTTNLRLDGVDAAQVLDYAGWTGPPLSGTIHYSGTHRIDSTGLPSLRGSGVVDAVGHYRSALGQGLPVEVTVDLSTEGETVHLLNGTLRAGSTRASFSGSAGRGEGITLRMSGGTGNLSEILPLFAPPKKKAPPAPAPKPPSAAKPSPAPKPSPPPKRAPAPKRSPTPKSSPAPKSSPTPPTRHVSLMQAAWPPRPLLASWPARRDSPLPASSEARPPAGGGPIGAAGRPHEPTPAADTETPLEHIVHSLGGRWEWDGDLSYGRHGLNFSGRLTGSDLTYQGTPVGTLRARVVYRDDALAIEEATLEPDPDSSAKLSGRIDFRGEGALSIEGTATRFPVTPILAVVGMKAPVAGRLSGSITLAGRPEAPTGHARVEVSPVVVAGLEFETLRGDLVFTPDLVEMNPVRLTQGKGQISVEGRMLYRGAGWVPEEGSGLPRIKVKGTDLDLSFWSKVARGVPLEGTASIEGAIEGALEAPRGSIAFRGSSVKVRGVVVGDLSARVDLSGEAADLVLEAPERGVKMTGRVGLGEGKPLDLRVVLSEMRLRGDAILSGSPEDIQVTVGGDVTILGRLSDLTSLSARASLHDFEASVAGVKVTPEAPIELTLESGKMRLAPAVLSGPGTRIEVRGEVDPGAAGTLDFAASGRFDLKLVRLFLKNLQATGEGTVVLHVGGALASPAYEGRLVVEAGAIRHPDMPFPVDNLLGKAEFEGARLKIESLDFLAGGGPVTGTGEIRFGDLRRSESPFTISAAEVHFRGTSVKGEFPEGFRSVSDMDLTVRRAAGRTALSGTIDLVRGVYVKDFKLESSIGRPRASEVFRVPAGGLFAGIGLDLLVRASQDVWLRNDLGKIEGQGEVHVRGTTDRPSLAGRVTAVEGGTIRFRNVEYRVLGGTMDFADPEVINPIFDVQAETHVSEFQVTLSTEGTLDDFHYDLSSNPPLPEPDIVALLLTGRTLGSLGPETGGLAEETITSYLSGLTGELTGRVKGKAGFDVLNIDPLQVNAQGDPTTRITVGKQVTPDLFVAYSSDLGSTQGSVYQLDYALDRDLHFTSLRDTDGSIGGDFKFILRGKPPVLPGVAAAAPAPILGPIKVEGELRFKEKAVRRRLRVKEGRPRDRSVLNDGIDRVLKFYHDRGYLVADVDDHESRAPDGKVDLTFHVRAGPRVRIEIAGTRGAAGIVQEITPFWEKGLFLEDIVDQARAHIETLYRDRGFLKAEVTSEVLQDDAERVQVRFTVRRGPRTQADEVRLAGVQQIPEKAVRKVLRTTADGPFTRGLVRQAVLEEDAAAVLALYLSRGFPVASVPTPEVTLDESGRRAVVTFRVREGPKVTFGRPRFEGNRVFAAGVLARAAKIPAGGPYRVDELDAAVVRLRRRYDDAGHPDARITCRAIEVGPDAPAFAPDPVFDIVEGSHQKVGEIHIAGNVITRDEVIRKALTVEPGAPLSRGDLQASQTRLYGRGIFRSVSIEPEPPEDDAGPGSAAPSAGAAGSPPDGASQDAPPPEGIVERDLRVSVRELPPVTQVFGIGYDSEEKLRGQYEISNRNIFGGGRYVGLQARASDLQQRGTLSYREKGILGGSYDILASAFGENEVRPSFDVRTVGSSIQVSRRFTRATRTLYRYSLKDVNLSDTSATFEGPTLRLSSIAASAVHDTRDAPFDPSRGHSLSGEVQFFGSALGSQADFVKMYAQIYRFKTIFPKTVWAQALRAGAAVPFGVSKDGASLTCTESTAPVADSGVPPSERFFAGGDTTVRGFERDRLGDRCNGDPLGGEGLFILNEELRFPIYNIIGGVLFYDTGNIYRTLHDYSLADLRHVAGAGLRLATPIGPFRLEYGAILDRKAGEPPGEFFFSIGQAF